MIIICDKRRTESNHNTSNQVTFDEVILEISFQLNFTKLIIFT